MDLNKQRLLISILGLVQGVGFRPFVYRLAIQYGLLGSIKNTCQGVEIDVQGSQQDLDDFQKALIQAKPERASLSEIHVLQLELHHVVKFEIVESTSQLETKLALLPDSAMCQECKYELFDPSNRRYLYPFLHCMTCGPRFSLFLGMPFDRKNTAMIDFPMCELCEQEYANPLDRRFYSQTNCCSKCGPKLELLDRQQRTISGKQTALSSAVEWLHQGKIVALKNTGGFLLLVDATNEAGVSRLRMLKKRAKKPFALLMPDLSSIKQIAFVSLVEEEVLTSPAAPIVLLRKKKQENILATSIALDSPYYGMMLPHNPIQYLLLQSFKKPLVATSGNLSGMPLCATEEEAFSQLSSIADVFLVHNRPIIHRVDDSIVQVIANRPMVVRRARGYIPFAVQIPKTLQNLEPVFASGGHLKNSFAFGVSDRIYIGQHIGDLNTSDACKMYDQEVLSWEKLLNIAPRQGVCDNHPDYYTSHYMQKCKMSFDTVQHHKAHVYSGMIDNQLPPPVLSFSWDGTGFGEDGSIWGGETFIVTEKAIEHFATLYPFRLPGSEKAVKEPRRSALGLLYAIVGLDCLSLYKEWIETAFTQEEALILLSSVEKGINAPICSSMGRLFDAVSALLGCCFISDFEGHAALALESLAGESGRNSLEYQFVFFKKEDMWILDWRTVIQQILEDVRRGVDRGQIARAFHSSVAQVIVQMSSQTQLKKIVLTGGVMQNKLLVEEAIARLQAFDFEPFWHHQIPPNDGGIAVGQTIRKLLKMREKAKNVLSIAG